MIVVLILFLIVAIAILLYELYNYNRRKAVKLTVCDIKKYGSALRGVRVEVTGRVENGQRKDIWRLYSLGHEEPRCCIAFRHEGKLPQGEMVKVTGIVDGEISMWRRKHRLLTDVEVEVRS